MADHDYDYDDGRERQYRCERCRHYELGAERRYDLPGTPVLCELCDDEQRTPVYVFPCGCEAICRAGGPWEWWGICHDPEHVRLADLAAWRRFVASGPEARIRQGTDRSIT